MKSGRTSENKRRRSAGIGGGEQKEWEDEMGKKEKGRAGPGPAGRGQASARREAFLSAHAARPPLTGKVESSQEGKEVNLIWEAMFSFKKNIWIRNKNILRFLAYLTIKKKAFISLPAI